MSAENQIENLIQEGERVREEKKWDEALQAFDRAIIIAVMHEKTEDVINILGHKLIIYKHLYYETNNRLFLELFHGSAETGLNIAELKNLIGQPKALALLRMGDYYMLSEKYLDSVKFYHEAVSVLGDAKQGEYGEYLGHLGFGLALAGDTKGFATLSKAYQIVFDSKDLRDFHKLIVLAGIRLREAKAYALHKNMAAADRSLKEAANLGDKLAHDYNLPLRLEEAKRLKKELEL